MWMRLLFSIIIIIIGMLTDSHPCWRLHTCIPLPTPPHSASFLLPLPPSTCCWASPSSLHVLLGITFLPPRAVGHHLPPSTCCWASPSSLHVLLGITFLPPSAVGHHLPPSTCCWASPSSLHVLLGITFLPPHALGHLLTNTHRDTGAPTLLYMRIHIPPQGVSVFLFCFFILLLAPLWFAHGHMS